MVKKERIVDLFCNLVQIDSESGQEKEIAVYLKKNLQALGLEVREEQIGAKIGSNCGNVIAYKKGNNGQAETLLFSAHMDTVKPGLGIKPQVRDDVIYSDGSTILGGDDKAGIAAILEALTVIQENNLKHGDLEIVFTVCEEIGLLGAKNLDFTRLKAKKAYILDSGGPTGTVIVQAPFHLALEVKIIGKSAHSGVNPEEGINAIRVAALALSELPLGRIDEKTTANFGLIQGGRASNIVPDFVQLSGEMRSLDEDKLLKIEETFHNIFLKVTKEEKAELDWKTKLEYKGFALSEENEVVKLAVQAAKNLKISYKLQPRGGGSDANIFNNEGKMEAVNLGIGLCQDHTVKEHLAIADLVGTANLLVEIITLAEKKNV